VSNKNTSPWLKQLGRTRPIMVLEEDANTNIAIVGGGIAGVTTAYFLLRDTDKSVTLLERDKVAHGATGFNGGQVVAAFETPLSELSKNFSYELISEGLTAINNAWDLLYSMIKETGIEVEVQDVPSYLGLSIDGARFMLEDDQLRKRLGLPRVEILLAEDAAEDVPEELRSLVRCVSRKELEEMLLTRDRSYDCALVGRSGLMNTALFCEKLISKMLEEYSSRFKVYENTPVRKIEFGREALLKTPNHELKAQQAILCTNGYTDLEIKGEGSLKCAVESVLGYMAGYLDERDMRPTATVYFSQGESGSPSSYFYLSKRKYVEGPNRTLTCMGGPNQSYKNGENYSQEEMQDDHEYARIDEFYRKNIIDVPLEQRRDFSWNGLMGYTSNGIRLIGPDHSNSSLIYNLGCNGIGILPSIYGGKRIAQYINGEPLGPSIFDPDQVGNTTMKGCGAARERPKR
jgi:glycine/D-amino acid oxidase-like deaminating enzyme